MPKTRDKSRSLSVPQRPGVKYDRAVCDLMAEGVASSGAVMVNFLAPEYSTLSLTDMVASLKAQGEEVNRGDLGAGERMLSAQAAALNAIFGELARRAALNMGVHLEATDRYMRLALKAQSQSRATVETLAAIKNPPAVFARQLNMANGPQQVNNTPASNNALSRPHVREIISTPTELLEGSTNGCTQLDTRATTATGRTHQDLEAVVTVNRAAKP